MFKLKHRKMSCRVFNEYTTNKSSRVRYCYLWIRKIIKTEDEYDFLITSSTQGKMISFVDKWKKNIHISNVNRSLCLCRVIVLELSKMHKGLFCPPL